MRTLAIFGLILSGWCAAAGIAFGMAWLEQHGYIRSRGKH